MKRYVRAEEGPSNSVIYYDEMGNKLIRYWKSYEGQPVEEAGTRSWRNNNPGNILIGDFARRNASIGEAGIPLDQKEKQKKVRFAVFPDYATGRKAQALRLKEGPMYIDLTLRELPRKYLGIVPGKPDTKEVEDYRKNIRIFSKLDMQRTIRSLNAEEYEALLDAMKRHEGWRTGREEYVEVKKVLGVRLSKKGTMAEFLVGGDGEKIWLSKNEAIALTEKGLLHAVVVHAKHGVFLRPEYHQTAFKHLVCS